MPICPPRRGELLYANSGPSRDTPCDAARHRDRVPVTIDNVITLDFAVDSGAADVQIPVDVVSTLYRANAIADSDLIGKETYVLADGSTKEEPRFLVHELRVGNIVLRNVPASVSPFAGKLLLGQSFLSQFDAWTLDNRRNVLRLAEKFAGAGFQSPLQPAQAPPLATAIVPAGPQNLQSSVQNALVCGRSVSYTLAASSNKAFLGAWAGNWNNASELCAGLIVEKIDPDGAADIIYIYGPSRPGSRLAWKQQHRTGVLSDGRLTFQDDQGSVFTFYGAGYNRLSATFVSGSGHLTALFQRLQ
jgi:hypothetical protein